MSSSNIIATTTLTYTIQKDEKMKNISAPNLKKKKIIVKKKKNIKHNHTHKIKENHYFYYDFPTQIPSLPLKKKKQFEVI